MNRIASAIACASLALVGCRTTGIGEQVEIPIPHNLSAQEAQQLVTRFIDRGRKSTTRTATDEQLRRVFSDARKRSSIARRYHGRWRIESWQPGNIVAAYAWRRHLLRVQIEFRNRTSILTIGAGENLRQSSTSIHRTAKALADELSQEIRFVYGKIASGDPVVVAAARSRAGTQPSLCDLRWPSEHRERERCRRAQRQAYDQLRSQIEEVETDPTASESVKLKSCYSQAQTQVGTDWELTARCFYSRPASAR